MSMNEIFGLPAHPLIIHVPVVLVPAFILMLVLYLFVPPLRQRIGWAVATLSFLAPLATLAGWWSGHDFYDQHVEMISGAGADPAIFQGMLADHLAYGDVLLWLVPPMSVLFWLFAGLDRGRRAAAARAAENAPPPNAEGETPPAPPADPARRGRFIVMLVLGALLLGTSGAAGWYVYQTGHTGAKVVWDTPKPDGG